jgi:hypothetical protein
MSDEITVAGLPELRVALVKLGLDLQDLRDVNRDVAGFVGARAATDAPRRSGMLAASWRPGATKTNATIRFGGAMVPYANAVHWGTGPRAGRRGPHNIRATLFATTAAADTQPEWLGWYVDKMQTLTDQAAAKVNPTT